MKTIGKVLWTILKLIGKVLMFAIAALSAFWVIDSIKDK